MNASRLVPVAVALLAGCSLLAGCGPTQSTVAPTPGTTATASPSPAASPSPSPSPAASPSPSPSPTPSILVGMWERHGVQSGKPYTEHFFLNPGGTYSIEARFDKPDSLLASSHGTWEATDTTLTLTDQDAKTTVAPYYLDSSGRLVIDNKPAARWTRVK